MPCKFSLISPKLLPSLNISSHYSHLLHDTTPLSLYHQLDRNDSMTGVKKESHQRQRPTRRMYSEPKASTASSDTIVIDGTSETNNNHHGPDSSDTMVIEVDMDIDGNDSESLSNIATQLKFGSLSSISESALHSTSSCIASPESLGATSTTICMRLFLWRKKEFESTPLAHLN